MGQPETSRQEAPTEARNTPLDEALYYVEHSYEFLDNLSLAHSAKVELTPFKQGEHNANFLFSHPDTGRRLVLRINYSSQMGLEHQIRYEFEALKALEPSGRMPEALFYDDSRTTIPRGALVMEFVDGEELDYEKPGDLEQAAQVLADVHSVVPAPDCSVIAPGDALIELFEECERLYSGYLSSSYVEKRVTGPIDSYFASVKPLLASPAGVENARHILNTEAGSAHFLIPHGEDAARGKISRMIDWEKPVIGEAARDVAYFVSPTTTIWDTEFIFDDRGRAEFVEAYRKSVAGRFDLELFNERFDAYLKVNALRGITWSANAWAEYHDPSRPLKNEKTRRKLETYLSDEYLALLGDSIFGRDSLS